MHFLLKAVVLQFAFMAVAEELQPPEWWVVVLKEDASMSPADHAQWAYEIHMENTHTAVDHIFGLVGSLRSDGYDFMTWEDTMDIIRQHPDVQQAELLPNEGPDPTESIIQLRPGVSSAKVNAAWAQSIHLEEQEKQPNILYTGLIDEQILCEEAWCYTGSFSKATLEIIRRHPDVESAEIFTGAMWSKVGGH